MGTREILLGDDGHYSIPGESTIEPDDSIRKVFACQAAKVVHVNEDGTINLIAWTQGGADNIHFGVDANELADDHATFHLSGDCPAGR